MEFRTSIKGKPRLLHEGNTYRLSHITAQRRTFRCSERNCKGSIVLDVENNILRTQNHNHAPNFTRIIRANMREELVERALTTRERGVNIVTGITKNLSNSEQQKLPAFSHMRDVITKKRNNSTNRFDIMEEDIPEALRTTLGGSQFFRHDSGIGSSNRIIIFCSDFSARFLSTAKVILVDGTFRSCPRDFCQIFSLHVIVLGKTFPLAFALLSNKCQDSYSSVMTFLKINHNLNPNIIISDFEQSIVRAFQMNFPLAKLRYCIFHYGQSIWRKVQSLGLQTAYRNDDYVKTIIRKILNLVYFAVEKIPVVFKRLKDEVCINHLNEKINELLTYFEVNYVGYYDDEFLCTKPPKYLISSWSAYDRVLEDIPRTTNAVEAWHRTLNAGCDVAHPNIARLIEVLKAEEELVRLELNRRLNGVISPNMKTIYYDFMLKTVVSNELILSEDEYYTFLNRVAKWRLD